MIETPRVFHPKPVDFNSRLNPSQAFPGKHVSYPRLIAAIYTDGMSILSPKLKAQWLSTKILIKIRTLSLTVLF